MYNCFPRQVYKLEASLGQTSKYTNDKYVVNLKNGKFATKNIFIYLLCHI